MTEQVNNIDQAASIDEYIDIKETLAQFIGAITSNANAEQQAKVTSLLGSIYSGRISIHEVVEGISVIHNILEDNKVNQVIAATFRDFFNKVMKAGLLYKLDSIFEPTGNLLVGLEPQRTAPVNIKASTSARADAMLLETTDDKWEGVLPVIFVPGLAGTKLKNSVDNQQYWVNPSDIFGATYQQNLPTCWKTDTKTLKSCKPIVKVNGVDGVINLDNDTSQNSVLPGFAALASKLKYGSAYSTTTHTGAAISYDWRMAPETPTYQQFRTEMISTLRSLSNENSSTHLPSRKVYLLGHSVGNLMTTLFLHDIYNTTTATAELNNFTGPNFLTNYVQGYIAVSPPFGGCAAAIEALVSGAQKVVTVSNLLLGTFPGIAWSLPNTLALNYSASNPVVTINHQSGPPTYYNAAQMGTFLEETDDTHPATSAINTEIVMSLSPTYAYLTQYPNVNTFLITAQFETGTPVSMSKSSSGAWSKVLEQAPAQFGDGTVPYNSLHALDGAWGISTTKQRQITGCNHTTILSHETFLNCVKNILQSNTLPPP